MRIEFFVTKLRDSVMRTDTLVARSRGFHHLLSASLRNSHPENPRVENLITILGNSLERAISNAQDGREPDLEKLLAVLNAIEFHLDRFAAQAD